jgi:hypothetical protein
MFIVVALGLGRNGFKTPPPVPAIDRERAQRDGEMASPIMRAPYSPDYFLSQAAVV